MKHSLNIILIVLFCLSQLPSKGLGDIDKSDSLVRLIKSRKNDKDKIPLYIELGILYEGKDYVKAIAYCDTLLDLCHKNKDAKSEAETYVILGNVYWYIGEGEKSMNNYLSALKIREKLKDNRGIGVVKYNISLLFDNFGNTEEALNYAIDAISDIKKAKDNNLLCEIYLTLSNIYASTNDSINEMKYFQLAEKNIHLADDHHTLSTFFSNKGARFKKVSIDSTFYYYNLSLYHDSIIDNRYNMTATLNNLGVIYFQLGDSKKAIQTTLKAVEISEQGDLLLSRSYSFGNLASFYADMGDFKKAYEYYNQYSALKKELSNEENNRLANEIEARFQDEKKQLIIDQQKKVSEIKDAKIAQQDEESKRKNQQLIFIGIGFLLMIIISFIIYRNLQRKKRDNALIVQQKNEISLQKDEIEEKHNEIKDSIDYAQRIQSALFTNNKTWESISSEYFILFKPKDVVSGDFYWSHTIQDENQDLAIWCAADCTGHGVPGAFMSMLGISFLNEIVVENGETRPDQILNQLRLKIIASLMKENSEIKQRDGMDISFCVWNKKTNELSFTGANNPLWLIRKNNNEDIDIKNLSEDHRLLLIELKADKMPVGQFADEISPFSSQTIKIQKGDMIYSFSDGYCDQFGGPNGKKFRQANLKKLLFTIFDKTALEQKEVLENTFYQWKKNNEQVDDVCLIGIKI